MVRKAGTDAKLEKARKFERDQTKLMLKHQRAMELKWEEMYDSSVKLFVETNASRRRSRRNWTACAGASAGSDRACRRSRP